MKKYASKISLIVMLSIFLLGCKEQVTEQNSGKEEILWAAAWSHDGKRIAVGGNLDTLRILSGTDFKLLKNYPLKNTITKLKWHPSEDLLAIATQTSSDSVSILDFSSGELVKLDSIAQVGARGVGWNYNGQYLAVGDNEGQLIIFTKEGELLRKINTDQKAITGLNWHPSKNILVSVGSQIEIYNFDKDSSITIKPRPFEVLMLCVEWHKSGDFFVTGDYGDYDKKYPALLQFWDSEGQKIKEIQESKAEYRNLKWSADGEKLATASDALRIWAKNGELIHKGKSNDLLWGIDWSSNNQKIVTSSEKGEIIIWNNKSTILERIKY